MDYSATVPSYGQTPTPEKSSKLYIRDYPHRSVAIVSSSHALVFRHSASTSGDGHGGNGYQLPPLSGGRSRGAGADATVSKCIVEFMPRSETTLSDYRPLISRPIYGTLGLISVDGDVFLSVINHATRVATLRPGETVERIASVSFFCLNSGRWDDVVAVESLDHDFSDAASAYAPSPYGQNLSRREVTLEHPCQGLRKLLSNGTFYYSTDFDLTNRLQDR